ncbi:hypothetical protein [Aureitalea marina]|uniref:Bulb-type lectin domain-containing protein n=1 Tax=Aureitalea marina TaxID=930804 RepID=A0A2S7KSN6_9FLAO|nr:hypothetical protein [Aureitalea marina]PQB05634.1 hypothetical protein BST85_12545 [Aureitalea marina]
MIKRILIFLWLMLLIPIFQNCQIEELGDGTALDQDPIEDDDQGGDQNDFEGTLDLVITLGGSGEDEAVDLATTSDGGIVVAGNTNSTDGDLSGRTGNDRDYWVIKLNVSGEIVWSKTYGGQQDDRLASISATLDGGFVLSGYSRSSDGDVSGNEGFHDFWILKIDANGNPQWDQNFGYTGSDQAFQVIQTSDGGYMAAGFLDVDASDGEGNDNRAVQHGVGDYWIVKMDSQGEWIWRRYFGGTNNDRARDILQLQDGSFLVIGSSESDDFDITDDKGSYDMWVVKVSPVGDKIWTRSFGGSQIDMGYTAIEHQNGEITLVGDSRSSDGDLQSNMGNADAWLVRIDSNGDILDQQSYGGEQFDTFNSVYPFEEDKLLLCGSTRSTTGDISQNSGENDSWIAIIDSQGQQEFSLTVGGSDFDFGYAAAVHPDGSIWGVGSTESSDGDVTEQKGQNDLMIFKIK